MIDHITLKVSDLEKSKHFYVAALEPLGYVMQVKPDWPTGAAFCANNKRDLWIQVAGQSVTPGSFSCLAFGAANKEAVDAFYNAALKAGGTNNGAPGYRPQYHPGYYAAFVLDPDGNNIEAIFDDWNQVDAIKAQL